jgi:hypothetical protein
MVPRVRVAFRTLLNQSGGTTDRKQTIAMERVISGEKAFA